MSFMPDFLNYILAFETAFAADDWDGVRDCFASDASHVVHAAEPLGREAKGNDAIADGFRLDLNGLDRRFDQRIPEILDGPFQDDDVIWMRWALVFRRHGLEPLRIEGEHAATYANGKIISLVERVDDANCARVREYLARYGELLHPVGGSSAAAADEVGLGQASDALHRSLVRFYGSAKSRADIPGALSVCSPDFTIETVALGLESKTREETQASLEIFFAAVPDYSVELGRMAVDGDVVAAWGTARMTPSAAVFGEDAKLTTANVDIFCVLEFQDGLLARERFFFDLASLCRQGGLDIEVFLQMAGSSAGQEAA
jgi:predicted ester cyclase